MRYNEVKHKKVMPVFLITFCVVVLLWGCNFYLKSVQSSLVDQAISNVLSVTQQQEEAFNNFLARDMDRIHSFAIYFSHTDSNNTAEIQDRLTAFDNVDAFYTVINLDTGKFYNNKSTRTFRMSAEQLWEYRRLSEKGVRNSYTDLYTGSNMFGYYERFTFADGAQGLFMKGYENDRVSNEFSLSFYENRGFSYVVTTGGEILMRSYNAGASSNSGFTNIFDIVDLTYAGAERIEAFRQALRNKETGTFQSQGEEDDFVFTYVPVEEVPDWYIVAVVPLSAIMDEADNIIFNSQVVFVVVLAACAIVASIVWLSMRMHRNFKFKDKEIAYQEELFKTVFLYLSRNTDDVYMMLSVNDGVYTVEYISPNVERILGVTAEEVQKNPEVLGRAEYLDGRTVEFADLDKMALNETLDSLESTRFNAKLGVNRFFREYVSCVDVQGEKKMIVRIADRTQERETLNRLRMALDAARLASKAKSSFLSSVSHDIRTPMNAIVGLVSLMREEAHDRDRILEYTTRIDMASKHLLSLINDVLDMNKIESGAAALNISEMNMADVIDEINTIMRPQAKAKNQDFQIFASSFKYEHLLGDKMRINQVMINVLSNAVKYTQEGGHIVMRVQELPQILKNYSRIQIEVQDDGQGMSQEYQEVIFEPFTREHDTTTNKVQGTGLGMAITKNLVDLMGGSIKVDSTLGQGTKFTIELELRIQDSEAKEEDRKFWANSGLHKMLVVDDDSDICRNVVKAMAETGVEVEYVTSGESALEYVADAAQSDNPVELILLDWYMPGMDGLETARRLREDPSHNIPIILLTAYDWEEIGPQAMDIGIDHFLQKPFFLSNFKDAVHRVMGGGSVQEEKQEMDVINGKHIMIVEDIEVNRMILVKIMTSRGATCEIAENGQKAVEMFTGSEPGTYDIILMDVQMPVMDGYEATRQIRASEHPEAKTVPIVAMTANAFADDVRAALESGMDAHVAKPIIMENLEKTLREVLQYKDKKREKDQDA